MNLRQRIKLFRRKITYSKAFIRFLASVAVLFYKIYIKTLKIEYVFHPGFAARKGNRFLFGFWHGRQFLLVPSYGKGYNVTLMSDLSWAGEIQARILAGFGYTVVRGSSKRRGIQALLEMKKELENGRSGAFALDGPSGPIYRAKPGMLFLAKKMRIPVVPLISSADRAWIIKTTWCRYLLPKPFARCVCILGKPVDDVDSLDESGLDALMMQFMNEADDSVGRPREAPEDKGEAVPEKNP